MTKPEPALDALHSEEKASALTFPCTFPIKIMGRTQDGFAQSVADVVRRHAPDFDPALLEMRSSKEGNWLSVTATVNATSREQLDDLYRELVAHPMVKMVL
jgi:putative lipoic acid-binding regulatory protein